MASVRSAPAASCSALSARSAAVNKGGVSATLRLRAGAGAAQGRQAAALRSAGRRGAALVVKAVDEDEELPTPKFQVRRLQPLPADFGTGEEEKIRKPRKKAPAPEPAAPDLDGTAPLPNPVAGATKPAASPFASGAAKPSAPSSPFAANAGAAKPAASPFASGKSAASPFSNTGAGASRSGPASPFQASAADVANSMAPLDEKIKADDGEPFWKKIPLPNAGNLILVFTFGSIISLMLATFSVVVQLGGIRLND